VNNTPALQALRPAEPAAAGSDCALLSPAESERLARPLRAWRADQRAAVQACFDDLSRAWHRAWGLSGPRPGEPGAAAAPVATPSAPAARPVNGWRYLAAAAPAAWEPSLHRGQASAEQNQPALSDLHLALFGETGGAPSPDPDSLAAEIAGLAWADWWQRLQERLPAPAPDAAYEAAGPWWSGKLQVQLPWCAGTFIVELDAGQVAALLAAHAPQLPGPIPAQAAAARPKKTNVAAALGARGLPLRATLNGVELSLRQLQSLRVGDVVPLEHRLDEPAMLESPDATVVCHGWLGQQAGRVAVEMVRR
jgi:hypothetical protein